MNVATSGGLRLRGQVGQRLLARALHSRRPFRGRLGATTVAMIDEPISAIIVGGSSGMGKGAAIEVVRRGGRQDSRSPFRLSLMH